MISPLEIVLRLVGAAVLGAVIGVERERHSQPAGLRTHMILTVGAALAMILSIEVSSQFREYVPNGDPARLAAQVISGIGFLGAGAIIRYGPTVRGLTTATSLWAMAVVGLAVGSGHYVAALTAAFLLLVVLDLLDRLEKRFLRTFVNKTIKIKIVDRPWLVRDLTEVFASLNIEIISLGLSKNIQSNKMEITAVVRISDHQNTDHLIAKLSQLEGASSFSIQ